VLGEKVRRDQVLLDVVEAAAMHLPFLAVRERRQARRLPEPEVERDEVEARADPGDGGDDMRPPHREVEPFPEDREIGHWLLTAMAASRAGRGGRGRPGEVG